MHVWDRNRQAGDPRAVTLTEPHEGEAPTLNKSLSHNERDSQCRWQ